MSELVAKLPKDIQSIIASYLSMPTADLIRDEIQKILTHFISLTADERKQYDLFENKSFNTSSPFRLKKLKGCSVFETYWFLLGNEYSARILKNYGIMLIGGLTGGDRQYPYSRSGYVWDDIYGTPTSAIYNYSKKNAISAYRKDLMWYLKKNQIEYKEKAQLKTLIKMVQDIPNSEEKYETKKPKTKTIKKKVKLILVD